MIDKKWVTFRIQFTHKKKKKKGKISVFEKGRNEIENVMGVRVQMLGFGFEA